MVPTEWKPTKAEMKKAEEMLPKNEPQGLIEVRITAASSATDAKQTLCTLHHNKTNSE